MTAWMIIAAFLGVAIVLSVILQHVREVRKPPPLAPGDLGGAYELGVTHGLEHAVSIAGQMSAEGGEARRTRADIVHAIRAAKRGPS
jgi:hypothetical protein